MAPKVYITDLDLADWQAEARILERVGADVQLVQSRDPDVLAAQVSDADGLLVQYAPITAELIAAAPGLKVIARYGIGVDNVDVAAATTRGIYVCNSPDYCLNEVADHTLALLLTTARGILPLQQEVARGGWSLDPARPLDPLAGASLGLIGLGRIGQAVAARARVFGLRLLGHDPYMDPGKLAELGVELLSLDDLLAQSDYVSLHIPLTPETRALINRERLAKMRRGTVLINTARGGLVDTDAVVAALESGHLRTAALDVLDQEPPTPDHPLRRLPGAILTPHASFFSESAVATLQQRIAEDAARVLSGEPPLNAVNGARLAGGSSST